MENEKNDSKQVKTSKQVTKVVNNSAIYGLAVIGALVYYLQHATSFTDGIRGIGKAVFWPAVVIYKVLEMLKL